MFKIKIDNRRPEIFENLVGIESQMDAIALNDGGAALRYIPGPVKTILTFRDHRDYYGKSSWKYGPDGTAVLCLSHLLWNEVL